jgi:tetratricopeptide (TPR) repeat protein
MPNLFRFCSILFFLFLFSCAERTIVIERPGSTPPPPPARPSPAPPSPPAKNYGQTVASGKHLANGKKFYNRGKYAKAMQEFNKAVEADPRNQEAHYYLGLCYQKLRYYKESIPEFKHSLEVENGDKLFLSKIRFSLAYSLEMTGDLDDAERQYELAYSLDPHNKSAYKGMERVKEKRQKHSKIKIKEK